MIPAAWHRDLMMADVRREIREMLFTDRLEEADRG